MALYESALRRGVAIAPGPIFSPTGRIARHLRLNAAIFRAELLPAVGGH